MPGTLILALKHSEMRHMKGSTEAAIPAYKNSACSFHTTPEVKSLAAAQYRSEGVG